MSERRSPYIIHLEPFGPVWKASARRRYAEDEATTLYAVSKDRALRKAGRWCSRHAERERAHREAGPYIYEYDPSKENTDA